MVVVGASDDAAVVEQRLQDIQNKVPLTFNKYVSNYIGVYGVRKAEQTAKILATQTHAAQIDGDGVDPGVEHNAVEIGLGHQVGEHPSDDDHENGLEIATADPHQVLVSTTLARVMPTPNNAPPSR